MRGLHERVWEKVKQRNFFGATFRYGIERFAPTLANTATYEKLMHRVIKKKIANDVTLKINIETTNRCNAKCTFCPRDELTRPQVFMTDELFQEIVERITTSTIPVVTVNMNGFGEPFLDAKLCDRINYLKKKAPHVKIFLYSNGALLVKSIADKVLQSKLDGMNISFNGSRKEYNTTMVNLDFEKTKNNIVYFLKERKRLGKTKPVINLSCTYNDPKFDKEAYRNEFKDLVDGIFIQSANKWGDGKKIDEGIHEFKHAVTKNYPCKRLWTNLWIACNGDVHICCKDFNGEYVVGNIHGKTIEEVWSNPVFQGYRKMHLEGQMEKIPICKGCEDLQKCGTTWLTVTKNEANGAEM